MAYDELYLSGTADANGALTLAWFPTNRRDWTIRQVCIEMTDAPGGTLCALRKKGRLISPLVPNEDAASGDPSILQRVRDRMSVEWTGADPGNVGYVTVIFDDGT